MNSLLLASPFTVGVSLAGLIISTPRIDNARHKRAVIEATLHERGMTYHTLAKDVLFSMGLPIGLAMVILGFGPGIADAGLDATVTEGFAVSMGDAYAVEATTKATFDGVETLVEKGREKI